MVFILTPGNVSDVTMMDSLLVEAGPIAHLIGDKGYDSDPLRRQLKAQGTKPVIPGRCNRKRPPFYDKQRYKERWRIEAVFCRLKDFRRIATRYDKLARNFLSAVALAAILAYWI